MSSYRIAVIVAVLASHWGLPANAPAQRVRAVLGEPFNVAHVSVPLNPNADPAFVRSRGFEIIDPQNRVLYPAMSTGRLGELAGEILGIDVAGAPEQISISFLFRGAEPFEITVLTPEPQRVQIAPVRRRGRGYQASLMAWWRSYHAELRSQVSYGDYPPVVETYLAEMLSQRLGMSPPLISRIQEQKPSELQQILNRLFGTEELRLAAIRNTMRDRGSVAELADIPVPAAFDWQPPLFSEDPAGAAVEPIANHVPEECFYIRFGSFENYVWMDHLKDDYGGDLNQMITLRGHNAQLDERVQTQLAITQNAMKEFFGPQIISDVALIGRDLYLREGAALGVLFEAKNSDALRANFDQDRATFLRVEQANGAKLETVSIGGRDVSYLSTPDNRLRSYYAADGNYHLVTTSRAIVARFFEAGAGRGSLAASREFQHAREAMPLSREDTIFAYFSTPFFGGLVSPQYQIGLSRRQRQDTQSVLLQLATLAATGEGRPPSNIQDLIAGGFLPRSFPLDIGTGMNGNAAPESGRPVRSIQLTSESRPASGTPAPPEPATAESNFRAFSTPIPDLEINAITRGEATQLERSAAFFQSQWQQMDPLMVGIKRYALPGERMERVVIDGNVSPFAEQKYGWLLSLVGPPADVEIQSNPADVITLQMSLQGGTRWPNIAAHQVFGGVQDAPVGSAIVPSGRFQLLRILRTTPSYLGAWPKLGLLDLLPLMPPPDAAGFSPLPAGLWRWQGNGFSALSFNRDVLADAAAHLQPVPAENPAQIRLNIGNLQQSQLADWVASLSYSRAYQASLGNARLLHVLSQQLRVPKDQSFTIANRLLDTRLVCSLGGEYALHEHNGSVAWRSTAWPIDDRVPADYRAPLLEWFRGTSADITKTGTELTLHAEIDMQRKEREPQLQLPSFDLFKRRANP
ncbi:MAG: hypothetical protein KF861_01525 [Planctomycetaceae bacterium]|nr:hypothetical protein [Planctomycetaceae bacterium]